MTITLQIISGICWSLVYIALIRGGFRDHTYGMPLFALGLNICWELLYTVSGFASAITAPQTWVNLIWAMLDVVIMITYFKYGKTELPANIRQYTVWLMIVVLLTSAASQLAFYLEFGSHWGSIYSAFTQNAIMSILFLAMVIHRNSTRGLSKLAIYAKWLGTLAPTILGGVIEQVAAFVLIMGGISFIFDLLLIFNFDRFCKRQSVTKSSSHSARF
jgi:hypothetical protein